MVDKESLMEDNYILNKPCVLKSLEYLNDSISELNSAINVLRARVASDESLRSSVRTLDIALVYAKESRTSLVKQTKDQLPF